MSSLFVALFALVASSFRTRAALQAEILALRHQLAVCQKNAPRRLRLHRCDRLLWVLLYRFWSGWRRCLEIVHPDTVLRWHCRAFAWHWTRKSRHLPGRPEVAANIRNLIQRMSQANAGRDTNSISCGKGRFPPIGPYLRFMSDHAHVLSSLSLSRQPLSFSKLSPSTHLDSIAVWFDYLCRVLTSAIRTGRSPFDFGTRLLDHVAGVNAVSWGRETKLH
jgi:hypothetical protein